MNITTNEFMTIRNKINERILNSNLEDKGLTIFVVKYAPGDRLSTYTDIYRKILEENADYTPPLLTGLFKTKNIEDKRKLDEVIFNYLTHQDERGEIIIVEVPVEGTKDNIISVTYPPRHLQ